MCYRAFDHPSRMQSRISWPTRFPTQIGRSGSVSYLKRQVCGVAVPTSAGVPEIGNPSPDVKDDLGVAWLDIRGLATHFRCRDKSRPRAGRQPGWRSGLRARDGRFPARSPSPRPPAPRARSAPQAGSPARRRAGRGSLRKMSRTISGARPRLGSSSMSRSGRAISARPMASICRSPPESVPASWRRRSASRGKSAKTSPSARCIAAPPSARRRQKPRRKLSSTGMVANSSRVSGTRQRPSATRSSVERPRRSRPLNAASPAAGSTPMTALSSVVLPAPLGPITVAIRPASTRNEMPCTAPTPP